MHTTEHHQLSESGFTLIELILYIALVSIFVSGAILFAWDSIYGQVKSGVQQEVSHNLRLASNRIAYEIRNATGITTVSASSLELSTDEAERNPTIIDLNSGTLRIGYGVGGDCPTSAPCALTSDTVTVTDLTFTDLSSSPDSLNVEFSLTIEHTNLSNRVEWERTQTYTSSVEVPFELVCTSSQTLTETNQAMWHSPASSSSLR